MNYVVLFFLFLIFFLLIVSVIGFLRAKKEDAEQRKAYKTLISILIVVGLVLLVMFRIDFLFENIESVGFLAVYISLLLSVIFGVIGILRTPKEDVEKRKKFKMMIKIPLIILGVIIGAVGGFFLLLLGSMVNGM